MRYLAFSLTAALALWAPSANSAEPPGATATGVQLAQYYPPNYQQRPGYYNPGPPPCNAYGQPFRGAARGAAAGAIFGGIAGNAGTGAAVGAGIGLLGGAIRNSNARANGWCY